MIVVLNSGCFGRNLEYLRKRESMSRFRLARLLNLSVLDLFCVEKGNLRDVDFEVLQKISRLFQVDLQSLLESDLSCKREK